MPEKDVEGFKQGLINNFNSVIDALSKVDAENSRARIPEVEESIKDTIKRSPGGFSNVNKVVIGALREWLRATALQITTSMTGRDSDRAELCYWIGRLYQEEQKWLEAKEMWEKSRDLFENKYG